MNEKYKLRNIEPGIYRQRGIAEFRILESSISKRVFIKYLKELSRNLGMQPHPELPEPVITSASGYTLQKHDGLEGFLFWLESGLHAYYWKRPQIITVDMHSCKPLIEEAVENTSRSNFSIVEYNYVDLVLKEKKDSQKVRTRIYSISRKGLIASKRIKKDEYISGYYGEVHEIRRTKKFYRAEFKNAVQFAEHKWREPVLNSLAQNINHACVPNCGIKGMFDIVAIRNIEIGEELLLDYAMTEDSDLNIPKEKCLCGTKKCRGKAVPYKKLPKEVKVLYNNYISEWLKNKYYIN
ncbi:MAG: SET domain-containing protein-lysine N-methyltransferase [Patescibacteria group bacterium]